MLQVTSQYIFESSKIRNKNIKQIKLERTIKSQDSGLFTISIAVMFYFSFTLRFQYNINLSLDIFEGTN